MVLIKKVLKNGMRVLLIPNKESLSVNLLILVEAGSKYEKKEQSGISHFLEHMCFKGTVNRPTPIELSRELDSLGAQYNAFTSQEYTGYYITCLPEKAAHALDVLADMYKNPLFNQKELEKERGVIAEEINMYEDIPKAKVQDVFMDLLYGDQPAGWSILGTKETLSKMNQKDFIEYRRANYVTTSTIVVASGNFDQTKIFKDIQRYFGEEKTSKKNTKKKVAEKQTAPAMKIKFKDSDQTHLVMGFRSFGLADKNIYIATVLGAILGGGMSSRLFQRVREELGAAYYVNAGQASFTDHGFLGINAGIDTSRMDLVLKTILAECKKLTMELVPAEELTIAKDSIVGNLYLGLETPTDLASFYGFQEALEKKILKPAEVAAKVKAVTAEEIRRLAKIIFKDQKLNLAVVGPHQNVSAIAPVLHL